MARFENLRWNPNNINHILRHGVRTAEATDVLRGDVLVESTYAGRMLVFGATAAGRCIAVILYSEPNDVSFPVAAWPASRRKRARLAVYRQEQPQ